MKYNRNWSIGLGAAFLMATSAVGPGFLTQTTVFTQSLTASFGFVILISIILDIGIQLNIWRIIIISGKRAQEIANTLLPGLGLFISLLIVLGGFAFNIGNIAGAGLGLNVLFGVSVETGAVLTAIFAIGIFLMKEAGKMMDRFSQVMGAVMIILIIYVAIVAEPPVAEAAYRTLWPAQIDRMAIVTLVGGTVGGYITFAGGHRLLDAGIQGKQALRQVTISAVTGIGFASIIRVFLFLAALGVISQGLVLDAENPPASVFKLAAGKIGYALFGIVMFAAAITSVVGSAYTSVSFVKSFHPALLKYQHMLVIGFILISTLIFISIGRPVKLLILAGALNGLILPVTLATILVAAHQAKIIGDYKHPLWLTLFGCLIVLLMAYMGGFTLVNQLDDLWEAGRNSSYLR